MIIRAITTNLCWEASCPPMTDGSEKPMSNRVKLIAVQEDSLKLFAQTL